ncbi:disintegrin and metalloproteinase domain-containing protein 10-like [Porites lutea]|uniref:disintegrin and metalloproteinase domain-containing protein 10-like n=1 Tax=Porites lutea TaxID=51062 RepID=UPI003CC65CC6
MAANNVFFVWFVLLFSYASSYRRPLGDYINHYETLNYDKAPVLDQHNRVRRSSPNSDLVIKLSLKSSQREFKIRLKRDAELFTQDFKAENSEFDPAKVVTGNVEGYKNSLVHGFISDDGVFEGKIHVGNDEYFVESAKQYFKDAPQDFHSVIYESRDVHYPHAYGPGCGINDKSKRWMDKVKRSAVRGKVVEKEHDTHFEPFKFRYRRAVGPIDKNKVSCTLKMNADHLFTANMANGNKERALLLMANHVKAVNAIYKNTGFADKSKPEGIQFQIQRMRANYSVDAYDRSNPYRFENIELERLLELHSEENHDDLCLAYLFTYRDFGNGALGLSWQGEIGGAAGGICEKRTKFRDGRRRNLNTGVVTFIHYRKKVTPKISEITFAHETGHNFGSPHDPANNAECVPGGSGGNFIMFGGANTGEKKNNRRFSPCSRSKINAVMNFKGRCPDSRCCFKAAEEALCGNMVVEKGEQCDCGYQQDTSCTRDDKCCEGRNGTGEPQPGNCQLLPGKTCSPSQGPCCSNDCTIEQNTTLCLEETECSDASFCNGISATCPAPRHKANLTVCNHGTKVCASGVF